MIEQRQDDKTVWRPKEARVNDPNKEEVPAEIGRYRVVRLLGEGGFGRVYLAHDDELHRHVAVKVPHRHRVSGPQDVEAYLAEARILASLDHPHIVPVHDLGRTEDGLPFVVSKFIEGGDLKQRLKESRLSLDMCAALVATVAEALHHAHRKGVVHRDIKPGNILLDSSGNPYVADFGLALREEDFGKGATCLGTPAYMSPEQARGEGHRVDGRSDIFSLSVVFYELLTGRRPFRGETQESLREQIATVEARPPRQVDDAIPRELERVCLKALSKRASERYTTAKDMADDLRHFVAQALPGEVVGPEQHKAEGATPTPSDRHAINIVPKGLRSFNAGDADFFLELLPDPRDRDGLPESLRFWKQRIEEVDADQTFAVGLLYGPSGCGKSSLVKAGLLPRLAADVTTVYVEATADETEARLLKGLRKRCPALPTDRGLAATLATLRRGTALQTGEKVLIVLDQFEQWLHSRRGQENTELMQALRHCEGARVQCLILVRDDFWMAATRFLRELEVRLVEGENAAAVDLFDMRHAKKVLSFFGRAFGALPLRNADLTADQARFLDQAVQELSRDGKVVPVRLAVFAEMVKGREWTPATLKALGGMEGVGVTFLEEAFISPSAPPGHRLHQVAARAVLKTLLPELGTDIRGTLRPRRELLQASGYASWPHDFEELLHILDRELRLVSPSAPEGLDSESGLGPAAEGHYYQLTHDYLVPALREWLTRKQKETMRGRAQIRLAERAAVWNSKPDKRHLPTWWEWARIRLLTRRRDWTPSQGKMMRTADRHHVLRGLVLVGALILVVWGAGEYLGRREARELQERLLSASPKQVPNILKEMAPPRLRLEGPLREARAQAEARHDANQLLRLSLALLPSDPDQASYLYTRLFDVEPQEFTTVRGALVPYKDDYLGPLWDELANRAADPARRFRAACALAEYAPSDPRWADHGAFVVQRLVGENALVLSYWKEALEPVGHRLLGELALTLEGNQWAPAQRRTITELYRGFAEGQKDALTRLEERLLAADKHGGPGAKRVDLARRKANVAAALVALGRSDKVWPLLIHSDDPTVRSCLIERLASAEVDPRILLDRLDKEPDVSARRALLLALGGFPTEQLPAVKAKLIDLYKTAPDAGLHAAAGWVLRHWGHVELLRQIDQGLATGQVQEGQGWYINKQGQTLSILRAPRVPGAGPERGPPARKMAPAFAIASMEVTVAQFRAFRHGHKVDERVAPTADCPVHLVTWYDAAAYCNWLSKMDGIPRDQWCYHNNKDGKLDFAPDYLSRTGYRLPTEAEWDFACRAGAQSGWCFGEVDEELLSNYAWWFNNAHADGVRRSFPVASLKPNDWGLFDMYGNVYEWCQEWATPQDAASLGFNDVACAGRGGCFWSLYSQAGGGSQFVQSRMTSLNHLGFRPARTLP
jgi:serine/threonine protein kinase/formylglycine-generating enzyme required for sulfatase activity